MKVWNEGRGSVVVFFYDSWHTAHGFQLISEQLREHFQVMSLDPPGFGGSPEPADGSLTVSDYSDLLGEFVKFSGGRDVTLVLCGLGLPIGLRFLAEGQDAYDHVSRVVITNGLLYADQLGGRSPFKQGMLLSRWELPMDRSHHRRRLLQFYGDPEAMDERIAQEGWAAFSKGRLEYQAKFTRTIDDASSEFENWIRTLGESEVPVLVLWGEEDPTGGRKVVERFQEEVPQSETYMLPSVGHFPHIEVSEIVADGITDFVKRNPKSVGRRVVKPRVEEETPEEEAPDEPSAPPDEQ